MKPEGISFEISSRDEDKTAMLEVIIEHHVPGNATKIAKAVMEILEKDNYEVLDGSSTPDAPIR